MAKLTRIDIIARNGNTGDHYTKIEPPCHAFYPKWIDKRIINGCADCVFVSKCVKATKEVSQA